MPKRSASPLTPRKKARSNEPFIQDLPSSFFPLHFILPLHRQPNSVAIAQVNAPHFNARPRPTYECPPPSAPLTSYLIRIRSTLRPPCRSQFTHCFCDFLRRYLLQLRLNPSNSYWYGVLAICQAMIGERKLALDALRAGSSSRRPIRSGAHRRRPHPTANRVPRNLCGAT